MRAAVALLAGSLLLAACRVSLPSALDAPAIAPREAHGAPARSDPGLGAGAAPGDANGPGGFVPRGSARCFYAGAGGRLWYYMNNYYWAPETAPRDDLWIQAEVVERFTDLRRWPDGASVPGPGAKRTFEYWEVGPTGRSVRLDNHKDYCLLSDQYTAGAIEVTVTLTLGRLEVEDARGHWGRSKEAYVLVSRNYAGGGGIGPERVRFRPLSREAETVWSYRVPWSTHPQRTTRSTWEKLEVPAWVLVERRPPPAPPAPVVTPPSTAAAGG